MPTESPLAYDRAGPRDRPPVVLIHAGIADRRMWDPLWPSLVAERDAVRVDLRGFGESSSRPHGDAIAYVDDVLELLAALDIGHAHLVGASLGAGVAVELALTRPETVDSLLLSAPGGSLLAELTPDLRAFFEAERDALSRGDLDAAVEANLTWWVDGPHRGPDAVAPAVREHVAAMQRRAFELTAGWDDIEQRELDPPALERLADIRAPTLILLGELDLDTVHDAARRLAEGVPDARLVRWPDTAHLPSMERPDEFLALLRDWLTPASSGVRPGQDAPPAQR